MTRTIAILGMVFALAVTVIGTAYAGGAEIEAKRAWAWPSSGERPSEVYLRFSNKSRQRAILTGAQSPIARRAEIHAMRAEGGVMRMHPIEALDISAKSRVKLEPGGYHIMLFGLKKPLKKGMKFPLTLTFDEAEPITLKVKVRKRGGNDDDDDDDKDKNKKDPLSGKLLRKLTPSPD